MFFVASVMTSSDQLEQARQNYQAGRAAFERGRYRESVERLQQATAQAGPNTPLGGQAQIWLVTAYEALEQRAEAIALCEAITQHPHYDTRKEANRLLYILKAPRLKTRPEWLTQIPELNDLEEGDRSAQSAYANRAPKAPPPQKAAFPKEPVDLSQVDTRDNGFVWVVLGVIVLVLGGLVWFGM